LVDGIDGWDRFTLSIAFNSSIYYVIMSASYRVAAFLVFFTLLSHIGSADSNASAVALVEVNNEPPIVFNVHVNPVYESNLSQIMWCFGFARDLNGIGDIYVFNATVTRTSSGVSGIRLFPRIIGFSPASQTEGVGIFGFLLGPNFNQGEYQCEVMAQDRAGDVAISSSFFKIIPSSCNDRQKTRGEEGVDCGGDCPPCACFNGGLDSGEEDVDCGGPCKECGRGGVSIKVSKDIRSADTIIIAVRSGNTSVQSAVRVTAPGKNLQAAITDSNGSLSLTIDSVGVWEYQTEAQDYVQVKKSRYKNPWYVKYLLYMILILGSISCVVYYNWSRKKDIE